MICMFFSGQESVGNESYSVNRMLFSNIFHHLHVFTSTVSFQIVPLNNLCKLNTGMSLFTELTSKCKIYCRLLNMEIHLNEKIGFQTSNLCLSFLASKMCLPI